MILAAGLGTRLRPLTNYLPKPLFPVLNMPLAERICHDLYSCGFKSVFINSFHLADRVIEWAAGRARTCGLRITVVREPVLLDTGGGIANVFHGHAHGDMPLLVINGDIVTNMDLGRLWHIHCADPEVCATMVLHDREPWNKVEVRDGCVRSFSYGGPDALAFTGISVLSPGFLAGLSAVPVSIIQCLEQEIQKGGRVRAVNASRIAPRWGRGEWVWEDMGSPAGYLKAHEALMLSLGITFSGPAAIESALGHGDQWLCVGQGVSVGREVYLERCVAWPGTVIPSGTRLADAIITPHGIVEVPR